jgi:hypothetical protein
MRVARFEDLAVWKKSKELSLGVYRVTNQGSFQQDFGLKSDTTCGCFRDVQYR